MKTNRILVLPVEMPINLSGAVDTLRALEEDQNLEAFALQLKESKQGYLDHVLNQRDKIDGRKIGYFYPIVNHAIAKSKPVHALGEEDFKDLGDAMNKYKTLSEICLGVKGDICYVCSNHNARLIREIKIIN